MEIHQSLKQCRLRRGLTQEQAAEQLHTTRQTISSYETGRTQPDLDALTRLAGLYGVSVERLLYGDREETGRLRLRPGGPNRPGGLSVLPAAVLRRPVGRQPLDLHSRPDRRTLHNGHR